MYATVSDVTVRLGGRSLTEAEEQLVEALLEDAAALIDATAPNASTAAKKTVSSQMVVRAFSERRESGDGGGYPIGASQGSMGGLGYQQSWTISSGGSVGELYLSKADKLLLGIGDMIGSHSPLEDMTCCAD